MIDTAQPNWLHRLRHSPMRDLLRGRVSGRLDWRSQIAAAPMPELARELITRITRRTRLWRIEKAAVADELIAHFLDGLEAGQAVEELLANFGDEKLAARLIRRGKIRNRPLTWHVRRWLQRIVVAAVLLYAGVVGYLCLGQPSPSVDYVAAMNAPVLAVPEQDRGWPLYRKALLALRDEPVANPPVGGRTIDLPECIWHSIDGRYWPEIEAYLRKHPADLATLRAAAGKPAIGFISGPGGSQDDAVLWGHRLSAPANPDDGGGLLRLPIPFLNDYRSLATILQADAKLAGDDGDSARLAADCAALVGMGRQLEGHRDYVVTQLVGTGIIVLALDAIDRALTHHAELLTDAQWIGLAHQLAGPHVAGDLINLQTESDAFHDFIQTMYTDDGHGDGHMTLAGMRFLRSLATMYGGSQENRWWLSQLSSTAELPLIASRKEILDQYDQFIREMNANLAGPIRSAQPIHFEERVSEWARSSRTSIRYMPLVLLATSLNRISTIGERELGQRDGVEAGIALELYHRQHGQYPATLAELTPMLLPTVPIDRITGEPVKYRLIDGKPVVYSVGVDRVDDHGTPPNDLPYIAAEWSDRPGDGVPPKARGDWVLYPKPPLKVDDDD